MTLIISFQIISRDMCIEVDITRVSLVARHKPVPIRLSEYYEPSKILCLSFILVAMVLSVFPQRFPSTPLVFSNSFYNNVYKDDELMYFTYFRYNYTIADILIHPIGGGLGYLNLIKFDLKFFFNLCLFPVESYRFCHVLIVTNHTMALRKSSILPA